MVAPPVVWRPDEALLHDSNVARFMTTEHISEFPALVQRSIDEPEWFWDAVVRFLGLPFDAPYEAVIDTSAGIEWATWFTAGRCNAATMCLSRLDAAAPAIVWEGEDGSSRTLSGAELRALTDRIAAGLAARGVGFGDAVGLFMPMVPETVAALFAIAKLGAFFLPIFSGYGADAVAIRLVDASAVAVVTAEGFTRRGKLVKMKETADAAVAQAPSVHTVLVVGSGRGDAPMHAGRDIALDDLPAAPFAAVSVDSEHPLFVAYTSGTTGRPKGAVHVHARVHREGRGGGRVPDRSAAR